MLSLGTLFGFPTNTTTTPKLNIYPEPTTRGFADLLSTCISTLIFCVWTAVHVDLPDHHNASSYGTGEKSKVPHWLKKLLRKLGWVFAALVTPGLVAVIACWQRCNADAMVKLLKTVLPSPPKGPGWGMRMLRSLFCWCACCKGGKWGQVRNFHLLLSWLFLLMNVTLEL
jgi:hypothetical protein